MHRSFNTVQLRRKFAPGCTRAVLMKLVDQTSTPWNQLVLWLRRVETLRRTEPESVRRT